MRFSLAAGFAEESVKDIGGDLRRRRIAQESRRVGDRPGREYSAAVGRLEQRQMGAAVVWVQSLRQQHGVLGCARTDLVGLMARRAVAVAFVQRPDAEPVAALQAGAGEDP